MAHVYLNADPDLCVCRGTGEYWAVGEPGQCVILNVFSPYHKPDGTLVNPDFDGMIEMLVPCQIHMQRGMNIADLEMLSAAGIALPSGTLPAE